MLHIYICEDQIQYLNSIQNCIKKTIIIHNLHLEIAGTFTNPHDLLNSIRFSAQIGIYFLDIDLVSNLNGLSLAQEIRKVDPRGFIIFITSHSRMCPLSFQMKLEILDYIVADDLKSLADQITSCLIDVVEKCASIRDNRIKLFPIRINDQICFFHFDDIVYFETNFKSHKITLCTTHEMTEFYSSLKEISARLDSRFWLCHRSYLVNTDYIRQIDQSANTLTLFTGKTIPFSTRKKKELLKFLPGFYSSI